MDPFPAEPRRSRAHRARTRRGARREGAAGRIRSAGSSRSSTSSSTACAPTASRRSVSALVGEPHADDEAAARGEADALLARPLRDRREQGARLPDDAPAERDVPRARRRAVFATCSSASSKIRRCSCISTTARTSRSIRTRTSAASCSSCSRWASGNYTEHDVREAARAFTGWTNDVLAFKFDAAQHDFGEKTFLGRTGPLQRRGHHRHHPQAAGHGRVRGGEALSVSSCARTSSTRGQGPSWDGRSATAAIR